MGILIRGVKTGIPVNLVPRLFPFETVKKSCVNRKRLCLKMAWKFVLRASAAVSVLIIISTMLLGCVVIQSSAISGRRAGGQAVSASTSDYGILRLTVPYGLTTKVNSQLVSQCPSGELTNVQTELSMRDFLLVQLYNLSAGALCQAAPPPPPPPPPPPLPPPTAQKIILRGVHFAFNKAVIRDVDKPVLDEAVETLKANPNLRIDVNGYTDAVGSASYNQRLSERRAQAVARYLEAQGIPASRLVPQGFGKTNFVATNKTREGRAQNRRVELVPVNQ
jgi:outer membrane protein OmpA-like peptidoglycan-associated protein